MKTVSAKRKKQIPLPETPFNFVADPPPLAILNPAANIQTTPEQPPGIFCRVCHCRDLRVAYTRHKPGGLIMRKRVCRNCGTEKTTYERESFSQDRGHQ